MPQINLQSQLPLCQMTFKSRLQSRSPSQFLVQNYSPVQFSIIIPVTKCILIQALLNIMRHIVWSCRVPKGMYWGPSADIASVPCVQLPQYVGLNVRLNRTSRTNTKSSVPQILIAFCKEIHVEKVHKFSSSGGELKEGHDALNLCQAEEEFREERAHF